MSGLNIWRDWKLYSEIWGVERLGYSLLEIIALLCTALQEFINFYTVFQTSVGFSEKISHHSSVLIMTSSPPNHCFTRIKFRGRLFLCERGTAVFFIIRCYLLITQPRVNFFHHPYMRYKHTRTHTDTLTHTHTHTHTHSHSHTHTQTCHVLIPLNSRGKEYYKDLCVRVGSFVDQFTDTSW